MAATVSSVWAKPGAWALDSEEHEEELKNEIHQPQPTSQPAADFPSLAAAAAAKPKKKNKPQTLSLAEFSSYKPAPASERQRLTHDEILMLPTGPRQLTAEELEGPRLGGGFRNYGGGDNSRVRVSDRNREGYNGNSNRERDMGPSRADEVDDWSKTKKFGSFGGGGSDRPERRERGWFSNPSRADEVDNWGANKSFAPPSEGPRRERRMGFESYSNGSGPESDNWLKKKEERAVDSDTWVKRENVDFGGNGGGVGRPRLKLQPRTLPVSNGGQSVTPTEGKPKGANPFGEARPREEVLAEKGKDWKEIDEKLDAVKIKELGAEKGEGFSKRRGFRVGRPELGDDRTGKSWRKPESDDVVPPPSSTETVENSAEVTEHTEKAAEEK